MNDNELKQYVLAQAAQGSTIYGTLVASRIYGPRAAQVRQNILQAITGKPVPKSKAGANAVRLALIERFNIAQDCIAGQDKELQAVLENKTVAELDAAEDARLEAFNRKLNGE